MWQIVKFDHDPWGFPDVFPQTNFGYPNFPGANPVYGMGPD
jgi:hypothetical protein